MNAKKKTFAKPKAVGKEPKKIRKTAPTTASKTRWTAKPKTPESRPEDVVVLTAPAAAAKPEAPDTTGPTPEERHKMIALAAYYLSLQRGPGSDPWRNWLDAEAEVEARLKK
jgi:hypothetical protein